MNLRFIEAFVWVARLRSFTAAAEKLNATQTAISARIATLEQDFGVKLFERDKRTVAFTSDVEHPHSATGKSMSAESAGGCTGRIQLEHCDLRGILETQSVAGAWTSVATASEEGC